MFKGLTNNRSDIAGAYIPEPDSPPPQSIALKSEYNPDQDYTAIESRIVSNTSQLYTQFINWKDFYITKFPSTFDALPAVLTKDNKVLLNMDRVSTTFNLNKKNFTISRPNDLAASILYGIHLRFLKTVTDDNMLTMMYTPVVNFIYSLILRVYDRDMSFSTLSNDDIGCFYYCVSRLVLSNYFILVGGNANGLAMRITHNFFTSDFKKRVTYNPGKLPQGKSLYTYEEMFNYLDESNIIPSVSLENFRSRVKGDYSDTALLCLTNGMTLASMLMSCRIPSEVFIPKIMTVNPEAIRSMAKASTSFLTKLKIRKNEEERERNAQHIDYNKMWSSNQGKLKIRKNEKKRERNAKHVDYNKMWSSNQGNDMEGW